jgi:hypothetical protein
VSPAPTTRSSSGEQPGDLHLGDADGPGDLSLGHSVEEPQLEDVPVPVAQAPYERAEDHPCLRRLHRGLVRADQVPQGGVPVADGPVERGGGEASLAVHGLAHVVDLLAEVIGQLACCRRTTEPEGELGLGCEHALLQLLDAARWPDHPAVVPEVPADLAADGRDAEGEERVAGMRIEAESRLGQRQVGDLFEVLHRDAAGAVARGDRPRHGHVRGDQVGTQQGALVLVGARGEQLHALLGARRTSGTTECAGSSICIGHEGTGRGKDRGSPASCSKGCREGGNVPGTSSPQE